MFYLSNVVGNEKVESPLG